MKKTAENALRSCPLFQQIKQEDLQGMLACLGGREISCEKGQAILAEGSPAREIGILLSGHAQVARIDYFGNRSILSSIQPGEMFGESFACAGVERLPVQVTAEEKSTALLLSCQRLLSPCRQACAFHRQLVDNLLRIMANKNLMLHQRSEITAHRTTREKLMAYLLLQAKQQQSSHIVIPFDRQGLADYLEVDRSGLSAEIGRLKKQGVLDCRKNQFTLLCPPENPSGSVAAPAAIS